MLKPLKNSNKTNTDIQLESDVIYGPQNHVNKKAATRLSRLLVLLVISSHEGGKRRKAEEPASPSEWPLHTKERSYCRDLGLETSHSFFQVLPLSLFGT